MSGFEELGLYDSDAIERDDAATKKKKTELNSLRAKLLGELSKAPNRMFDPNNGMVVEPEAGGSKASVWAEAYKNKLPLQTSPKEPTEKRITSPTRTYVVVCNKGNFDGHYLRKFTLPFEDHMSPKDELENNAVTAMWWFMNRIDKMACASLVMTWEDFQSLRDCADIEAEAALAETEQKIADQAKAEKEGDDMYPDFTP